MRIKMSIFNIILLSLYIQQTFVDTALANTEGCTADRRNFAHGELRFHVQKGHLECFNMEEIPDVPVSCSGYCTSSSVYKVEPPDKPAIVNSCRSCTLQFEKPKMNLNCSIGKSLIYKTITKKVTLPTSCVCADCSRKKKKPRKLKTRGKAR